MVEEQPNLTLRQESGRGPAGRNRRRATRASSACASAAMRSIAHAAVILTTGTFLQAADAHRRGQDARGPRRTRDDLGHQRARLDRLGFEAGRFKTGTPPRLEWPHDRLQPHANCSRATTTRSPFSYLTDRIVTEQMPCWITYTNGRVHELIRANLERAPMYTGQIHSSGPRYCPSIEDKVVRFADKDRHQLFLEPEGRNTLEYYVNGISTSLPRDVQDAIVPTDSRAGKRGDHALRLRRGVRLSPPEQLTPTLETKQVAGPVLRRADQRHHRLRRGRRTGPDGRRQRGAAGRWTRAVGAGRANRPTSAC